MGETPVPDIVGNVVPGNVVPGGNVVVGGKPAVADELGMDVLAATTTSDAVPLNDRAPEAVAAAEIRTGLPTPAVDCTGTLTRSSAAWPTGRLPTAHAAPLGAGHTVNVGPPT